jgi:Htaa protein
MAGVLAAALVALLALAPFASAAPDPVASGTTTVTFNGAFSKTLKKYGIKLTKISPAKVSKKKATFTVTGGSLDPTTGLGSINLGGGLQFKAGKKKAQVKALVLDTSKKSLTAKVAGKKMKMAAVAGFSFARNGFGVNLAVKKLKLTGGAASQLNKKLGFTGKSKDKGALTSKSPAKPFKGSQVVGSASAETQPGTVTVLPGGNVTLAANATTVGKLAKVGVEIPVSPPTTEPSKGTYAFPITGGTIGPTATAGVVQTSGGLKLVQKLPTGPSTALETEITLGNFYVDLAAKTVTVEVIGKSNVETSPGKKALDLGNLGRSSIADLTLTGATVTADPSTHTVSVQNASATLQPIAAEVLDGFVQIYEGYEKGGGPPVSPEHIKSGDPLGTISFTAQTQ